MAKGSGWWSASLPQNGEAKDAGPERTEEEEEEDATVWTSDEAVGEPGELWLRSLESGLR